MSCTTQQLDDSFLRSLRSPVTQGPLRQVGPYILDDSEELWPCIDGIPFMRTGRDALKEECLSAIKKGKLLKALSLLLTDRKDENIPPLAWKCAAETVVHATTISEAMAGLGYGGMAPYMYHRWCLPTYLSGLALLEAHAECGNILLEIGCGIGHFLRAWNLNSGRAIGSDLVFSNLWLARKFVTANADLVCFDADSRFPLQSQVADICFSQDAFHYFRHKEHVADEMKRVSAAGTILVGHVHNSLCPNLSPGSPMKLQDYVDCIIPTAMYSDEDLTKAALTGVAAVPLTDLSHSSEPSAFAFACTRREIVSAPRLITPCSGASLKVNPLLTESGPVWPSEKFRVEFADHWSYLSDMKYPSEQLVANAAYGHVGSDPECDAAARAQVILDLPYRWA